MVVQFKRLHGNHDVPLPAFMSDGAAAMDVRAAIADDATLAPGDIRLIACGFAMAIPAGFEAQVRPRSGLASKHGITLINSPGTIDSDYRGEVQVPLINHGKEPFVVKRGMRIAQMLILPVPAVELLEVDDLTETARGERGFGHTGHD
ncbi:MAG: dUTP diphosphatase [Phycisphaerae bacterium]|nr:dUTP diphosphatase [Phycisphaerae bacterium]